MSTKQKKSLKKKSLTFLDKATTHPEWENIRDELCSEYGDGIEFPIASGCTVSFGGPVIKQGKDDELWSKLCWYIGNGPGYCKDAPQPIQKLFNRLGLRGDIDSF